MMRGQPLNKEVLKMPTEELTLEILDSFVKKRGNGDIYRYFATRMEEHIRATHTILSKEEMTKEINEKFPNEKWDSSMYSNFKSRVIASLKKSLSK
jgi:hypothetical protein